MAKQCVHCGKFLPGETTRYCPGCGRIVAPSRPLKKTPIEEPPAWMKQLESSLTQNRSQLPLRELNVEVWDEAEPKIDSVQQDQVNSVEGGQDVVEALPTSPLMAAQAPQNNAHPSFSATGVDRLDVAEELPTNPHLTGVSQQTPGNQVASKPAMNSQNGLQHYDQIDEVATRPYVAQPRSISPEMEMPVSYAQKSALQPPASFESPAATQRPVTPMPLTFPQFPPAQPALQSPPESMPAPPEALPEKRSRKGLTILLGLLIFALLAGVIAWMVLDQPFSVPQITTTTQPFANTTLAISLQYPRDWSTDVHVQSGTVSFYDDNHTDQMNFAVVAADSQGVNQYSAKMANSMGMTGQKTLASLTFAGTTWQQIQGSVQLSGASYTATILVTMHGEHYYSIVQLAPSSTYPLEEQLVFSKMRSSFQF